MAAHTDPSQGRPKETGRTRGHPVPTPAQTCPPQGLQTLQAYLQTLQAYLQSHPRLLHQNLLLQTRRHPDQAWL